MNDKKAKRLRRIARAHCEGQPNVAYQKLRPSIIGDYPNTVKFPGQLMLDPACVRAMYQKLKRQ